MTLRFSDKPQLHYGGERRSTLDEIRRRFPPEAQGMESAPATGSSPVWVYENTSEAFLSVNHRGQWQKLAYEIDDRTGKPRWQMIGEAVSQPSAWMPATPQNLKIER
jgi:hypothetical protein